MVNPARKVRPGDPQDIRADNYNAMIDAAEAMKGKRVFVRRGAAIPREESQHILVKNTSPYAVPLFGVLALTGGIVIAPADNLSDFQSHPCLEAKEPLSTLRHWVVLQEPLAPGAIGRAVAAGTTVVKLTVTTGNEDFHYAEMDEELGVATLCLCESGQGEVLAREDGVGDKWAVIRVGNTPAPVSGATTLGIVIAPSSNGTVEASYTVEVHGSTIASLSQPAVIASVTAIQFPTATKAYWRGEIVGVTRIGDTWAIQKFLTVPIAYTVDPGQVALRVFQAPDSGSGLGIITNMMIDLADCVTEFDDGADTAQKYVVFDYAGFGGRGVAGVNVSVPVVYGAGWTVAAPTFWSETIELTRSHIRTGSPSTVSSSQDTFSGVSSYSGLGNHNQETWLMNANAYGAGAYVFNAQPPPGFSQITSLSADVQTILRGEYPASIPAGLFAGMPPLPMIPGGVDETLVLLGWLRARVINPSVSGHAGPASKSHPFIQAFRSFNAAGSNVAGSYNTAVTAFELSGPVTVS